MSSKSKKTPTQKPASKPITKLRWSIGVFESADSGEPIVVYCRKDGTVSPSYAKTVKNKKAMHHMIYFGMTYAAARAKLLQQAKVTPKKAAKKTAAKEVVRRAA